jgi:hypothetical protein
MPIPEKFFVSSLRRTGETCGLEWGWTISENGCEPEDRGKGVRATVIEVLPSFRVRVSWKADKCRI